MMAHPHASFTDDNPSSHGSSVVNIPQIRKECAQHSVDCLTGLARDRSIILIALADCPAVQTEAKNSRVATAREKSRDRLTIEWIGRTRSDQTGRGCKSLS